MVTHDIDIASYSTRTIHLRDGAVQSDELVTHSREAQKDLEQMLAEPAPELVVT